MSPAKGEGLLPLIMALVGDRHRKGEALNMALVCGRGKGALTRALVCGGEREALTMALVGGNGSGALTMALVGGSRLLSS